MVPSCSRVGQAATLPLSLSLRLLPPNRSVSFPVTSPHFPSLPLTSPHFPFPDPLFAHSGQLFPRQGPVQRLGLPSVRWCICATRYTPHAARTLHVARGVGLCTCPHGWTTLPPGPCGQCAARLASEGTPPRRQPPRGHARERCPEVCGSWTDSTETLHKRAQACRGRKGGSVCSRSSDSRVSHLRRSGPRVSRDS